MFLIHYCIHLKLCLLQVILLVAAMLSARSPDLSKPFAFLLLIRIHYSLLRILLQLFDNLLGFLLAISFSISPFNIAASTCRLRALSLSISLAKASIILDCNLPDLRPPLRSAPSSCMIYLYQLKNHR